MSKIFSNIKYLFSHNLKQDKQLGYAELDDLIDNLKYDLYDELAELKIPHIMDIHQTLEHLLTTEESIVRFGDGELNLMYGDGIALQEYSPEISRRLTEVFCSQQKNLMVAIPYVCYHSKAGLTEVHRHFWYRTGPHYRKLMKKYIDYDQIYGAAEVSLEKSGRIKTLWLIAGKPCLIKSGIIFLIMLNRLNINMLRLSMLFLRMMRFCPVP